MLHPFKDKIGDYLNLNPDIRLLIDIHGMAEYRHNDVVFGTNPAGAGLATEITQAVQFSNYDNDNPWTPNYGEYILGDNVYNANNLYSFSGANIGIPNGPQLQTNGDYDLYDNVFRTSFFNHGIYGLSYNSPDILASNSKTVSGNIATIHDIDTIQLRNKYGDKKEYLDQAFFIKNLCEKNNKIFIFIM